MVSMSDPAAVTHRLKTIDGPRKTLQRSIKYPKRSRSDPVTVKAQNGHVVTPERSAMDLSISRTVLPRDQYTLVFQRAMCPEGYMVGIQTFCEKVSCKSAS